MLSSRLSKLIDFDLRDNNTTVNEFHVFSQVANGTPGELWENVFSLQDNENKRELRQTLS